MNACGQTEAHALGVEMFGECPACAVAEMRAEPAAIVALPDPVPEPEGATYQRDLDYERLAPQAQRVWAALEDLGWHTLAELAAATGDPEASVSARLRDFRKGAWGAHTVVRERIGEGRGTWRYRLVPSPGT